MSIYDRRAGYDINDQTPQGPQRGRDIGSPARTTTDQNQPVNFSPNSLVDTGQAGVAPPPTGGHPSATSGGGPSVFGSGPYVPPEQQQALLEKMMNLGITYSIPGGGYLTDAEAQNANSYYNKFGGSDPAANKIAADFYGELGALPTAPNMTPSAQKLAAQTPGYQPTLGPSINEQLGHPWQGPWGF